MHDISNVHVLSQFILDLIFSLSIHCFLDLNQLAQYGKCSKIKNAFFLFSIKM